MSNVIRVALPGYNALTDTDPDHFSLYSNEDWVLIKEFSRGSISVNGSGGSQTITHNLGYIPFYAVYVDIGGGVREWIHGYNHYNDYKVYVTTTTMVFINNNASNRTFLYYIFYDKQK